MSRLKTAAATRARCRLGQGLCQARRQRGWARHDLAGQLAVSVSTIRRIERGDPGVALKTLMHGAVLLGLLDVFRGIGEVPSCFDDLCAVLDVARLGALRVVPHREVRTDRLMDALMLPREGALSQVEAATRAFEVGEEDQRQLLLLLYCATALGGARLKSTWIDGNGRLSLAKFDIGLETLSLNRAEVLAMHLAAAAGIDAVRVRLLNPVLRPILVGERFDRTEVGERRPFLSARSLLLAHGRDDVGPLELLQAMRMHCRDFSGDASQLWQRLVFMRLICQPGDDLRKIGFLCAGHGRWRLAPAYGLRLYPAFEPKDEAVASRSPRLTLKELMVRAEEFGLGPDQARWHLSRQLDSLGR